MYFLKELRFYVEQFESEARDDLHRFVDYLETKYVTPGPAVVAAPEPIAEVPAPEPVSEAPAADEPDAPAQEPAAE